jgi:hypothetical protein
MKVKECKNCEYYEQDFNGRECCVFETIINNGCPEKLPKERICEDFELKEKKA